MNKIKNLINKCIGKRGYSWTYHKMGLFMYHNGCWWFYPDDNAFICDKANAIVEWGNGNPIFD